MIRPLIVGLGSSHGDDQAGWRVIERLRFHGVTDEDVQIAPSPAALCHSECSDRPLIICDAANDGLPAGTIREWSWPDQALPSSRGGTHDVTLGDALSLSAQLGSKRAFISVWLISGRSFGPMSSPGSEVVTAAIQLGDRLYQRWYHA